ncbi:MAG: hypothetical protein HY275_10135 [Gemmatimonadetes bacterium]|nr:hypothetical protein [Gemmatimonadota bacterium]
MSGTAARWGLVLALAGAARLLAQGATPDASGPAVMVTVRPERARIGDPIVLVATVRAPAGATVEFPSVVNASESVDALDPRVVRVQARDGAVLAEATWRLVAWDTGTLALPLADAVVTTAGVATRVPLGARVVIVQSVLPADTSKREPRPVRAIVDTGRPWYDVVLPWLVPVVALFLGYLIWRRNRRERPPPPAAERAADRAFAQLAAGAFGAIGEPGREVAIATEIVRDFLAARFPGAEVALTTAEVAAHLPLRDPAVRTALTELLTFADLVKYARRGVNAEEAQAFTRWRWRSRARRRSRPS